MLNELQLSAVRAALRNGNFRVCMVAVRCLDHESTKVREEREARRTRSTKNAQEVRPATNFFVFFVLRALRPLRDFVIQTSSQRHGFR
jgi:hypothetical protein